MASSRPSHREDEAAGLSGDAAKSFTLEHALIGQLGDSDPNAQAGDYAVSVDWGDGQESSATVEPGAGPGLFNLYGTHTYKIGDPSNIDGEQATAIEDPGCGESWLYTVTAVDEGGSTASASDTVRIMPTSPASPSNATEDDPNDDDDDNGSSDPGDPGSPGSTNPTPTSNSSANLSAQGLIVNGVEGQSGSGVFATFIDEADTGGPFTATLTFDNGDTATGTVSGPDADGNYSVSADYPSELVGDHSVTVQIDGPDDASVSVTGVLHDDDAALMGYWSFTLTAIESRY